MKSQLYTIFLCIYLISPIFNKLHSEKTTPKLLSGPMIGYTAMREVQIWLQWKKDFSVPESVHIQFREKRSVPFPENDSINKIKSQIFQSSNIHKPHPQTGIVTIPLSLLEPGRIYEYKIFVNDKELKFAKNLEFRTKPFWQFRDNPPNVKFAIGSCNYINEEPYDRPGKKWGDGYEIFTTIHNDNPEFFLWLGDNVYLREADWDSESGIFHRYSHTRSNKEMQSMLSSMFHIAIWDDHDFGPNDASSSYGFRPFVDKIFKVFWPDPTYPKKGIYRSYAWSDIEFFLLDNRTFRTANNNHYNKDRTALGRKQKDWLFNALSDSRASLKFIVVGGQFINSAQVYENLSNYVDDRKEILDFIQKMKISGIVFLSGDRHHSELSRLDRGDDYPIYEWTISPLTAGLSTSTANEPNQHRVSDSLIYDRVYGLIEVSGIGKGRILKLITKNTVGKELYRFEIPITNLEKLK